MFFFVFFFCFFFFQPIGIEIFSLVGSHFKLLTDALLMSTHNACFHGDMPQPLYNTIVGVQSINHVSYTTVLYPNKNV